MFFQDHVVEKRKKKTTNVCANCSGEGPNLLALRIADPKMRWENPETSNNTRKLEGLDLHIPIFFIVKFPKEVSRILLDESRRAGV